MAKKTCSKGHIYDSTIYGDNCPFCPSPTGTVVNNGDFGNGTEVNQEGVGKTQFNAPATSGPTIPVENQYGGTVIRPASGFTGAFSGKRIMGLLITYNTIPTGQVFPVYEGRNYIGREANSDIPIQGDSQVSGKHFSILYRVADGKFKFKDEQSSNGTFLNEILTDEGELHTFDAIRIGSTRFIFIAIPQIQ